MQDASLDPHIIRTVVLLSLLTLPLKGYALWRSAQNKQKAWYIILLLVNSLGIVELAYLYYFSKPTSKDPK